MMRSIFVTLFVLVLSSTWEQGESLASIVRRMRRTGIWGKLTGRGDGFPQLQAPTVPLLEPRVPLQPRDVGGFDVDAYKREMIDLVYQRSMKRFQN